MSLSLWEMCLGFFVLVLFCVCILESAFTGSQFMETTLIGRVYSVMANEALSGKKLSFRIKSLGVLS